MKTIKDFSVKCKRVLVRCDFSVPFDTKGNILDDFRIRAVLPTITYLIKHQAKIILMSHLDNPDGTVTENLDKIKNRLEALLNTKIIKMDDCVGKKVENRVLILEPKEILLLENLRFHKEEFNNDSEFAKELSKLGEIYINDAFSVCHRPHASVILVPEYLPHGAGFLLVKEIENLTKILKNPKKPMVVLIGGRNVQTKSRFIDKISYLADFVIINGLVKKETVEKKINFSNPQKIISPIDNLEALDISDRTIGFFRKKILTAKTIFWNGPFGKFEDNRYKKGTLEIAKAIIKSKAFSVVGGGETVEFLDKENLISKFNHVSTGGGAMLDFLSGEELPGIKALEK